MSGKIKSGIKRELKRKTAFLLSTIMVIQSMLTGTGGIMTSRAAETRSSETITLSTGTPEDAFSRLTAQVSEGVEEGGTKLNVSFAMELNEPYLGSIRDQFGSEDGTLLGSILDPLQFEDGEADPSTGGESANGIYTSYEAYLNSKTIEPEMTFTCALSGTVFDPNQRTSGVVHVDKADPDSPNLVSYQLSGKGENLVLTATVHPAVYSMYDVKAGFSMGLDLVNRYDGDATVESKPGTGDVDIDVTIKGDPLPSVDNPNYSIKKEAAIEEHDPAGIVWTVHVLASDSNAQKMSGMAIGTPSDSNHDSGDRETGRATYSNGTPSSYEGGASRKDENGLAQEPDVETDLAGTVISDAIPEGLVLVSVESDVDSKGYTVLEEGDYKLDDSNILTYAIPSADGGIVRNAKLKIHTRLSDKLLNDHALSLEEKTVYEFSNRAQLLSGTDNSPLAVSDRVNETITLEKFFDKIGEPVNSGQQLMEWTLTAKPYFSSGVELYVIDHIEDIEYTHMYAVDETKGESVSISSSDGTEKKTFNPVVLEEMLGQDASYGAIESVTRLHELLGDHIKNLDENDALIYQYKTGKYKADGDKEEIIDAVMIIPVPAEYQNKEFQVTYFTDTTVGLNEEYEKEKNLENEAKAVWKWPEGAGIGPHTEFGSMTVEKGYPINYRLVSKNAGGYDYAANEMTWGFEVNQYRTEMEDLVITDEFDTKVQLWADESHADIVLKPVHSGEDRTLQYLGETKAEGAGDGYTVSADGSVFTAYIAHLNADEVYTFSIKTKLSAEKLKEITGGDTGDQEIVISNTAKVAAVINGKNIEQNTGAVENTVKNPLIDKEALPFTEDGTDYYNFNNHTVKWGVTINHNEWKIEKPGDGTESITVTDELPVGTTFGELLSVKQGEDEGTIDSAAKTVTFTDGTTIAYEEQDGKEGDYAKNSLVFTFDADSIHKKYTFELTTTVEEGYRENVFKSNADTILTNKATLKGKLDTEDFSISDVANHSIPSYPILKNGTYFSEEKTLDDGRKAEIKGFHWQVLINRTNVEMAGAVVSDDIVDCMELMPHTLKAEKVTLDEQGMAKETEEQSLEELLVSMKDYQFANVAGTAVSTADEHSFTYTIPESFKADEVLRISFDTVLVEDSVPSDMTNKIDVKNGEIADETKDVQGDLAQNFHLDDYATAKGMYYVKIKKTSTNKKDGVNYPLKGAEFTITSGTGTGDNDFKEDQTGGVVRVKVTNASGNANIVFLKPGKSYRIEETKAPAGYGKIGNRYLTIPQEVNGKKAEYNSLISIEDDPLADGANQISFTKIGYHLTDDASAPIKKVPLSGVIFTISHPRVTPGQGTAVSDASGVVTFKGLDPDAKPYSIKESVTPEGYIKKKKAIKAYVTADADGNITTRIEGAGEPGNYTITNEPIRQSGSFTKVDQNGDPIENNGISFTVKRKNDGLFGTEKNGKYVSYSEHPSVSVENGVVSMDGFLYGEYMLTENVPNDLHVVGTPDPVYIRVTNSGIEMQQGTYQERNYQPVNDYSVVRNTLQYGFVEVNKVIGEMGDDGKLVSNSSETTPIAGALFTIYHADESGSPAGNPVMQLRTNAQGKFKHDNETYEIDGSSESRALLVGKYVLKEETPADGYEKNETYYPFEIQVWTDSETPDSKTVVYVDSNNPVAPGTATDIRFYNEPVRRGVSLQKVDSVNSGKMVDGAVFDVYPDNIHKNTIVAKLKQENGTGKYKIYPVGQGEGGYQKSDPQGRLYVWENKSSGYELLAGSYTLKEMTVPDKYETTGDVTLTIDESGVSISGQGMSGENIINRLKGTEISVRKYVEDRKVSEDSKNKTEHDGFIKAGSGFVFTLDGTSDNGTIIKRTATTDNSGMAVFENVPIGNYIIEETGIPSSYKTGENEWLNKVSDSIKVTVSEGSDKSVIAAFAPNGAHAGGALPNNGQAGFEYRTDKTGSFISTTDNSSSGAVLHIADTWKLGSAKGSKKVLLAKGDRLPVAGIAFELQKKESPQVTVTAETNDNGELTFEDIPYGTYTLKEETPDGYKEFKDINVSIAGDETTMITPNDKNGEIINTPVRQSGSFTKVDQNGEAIKSPTVTFTVERKNDGLFGYSGGKDTYASYTDHDLLSADENGVVKIQDFLYGEYRLTENANTGLHLAQDAKYIFLNVTKDGIQIKQGDDAAYVALGSDYKVANQLQYGRVEVNKAVGEADPQNPGKLKAPSDQATAIEGAEFAIYRQLADGSTGEVVMTLTTNKQGNFDYNDGVYTTADNQSKYLLCGNYVLKETKVPSGYQMDKNEYPFTISPWTKDGDKDVITTVYIDSNDPQNPSADGDTKFYNEPLRNTVSIEKSDADNSKVPVSGAEFKIFTLENGKDVWVASLREDVSTSGTYVLAPAGDEKTDSEGRLYLWENSGTYHLLYGNYTVEESIVPGNYINQYTDKIQLAVGAEVEFSYKNQALSNLTNEIKTTDIEIGKYVETRKAGGAATVHNSFVEAGKGFEFTLKGKPENGAENSCDVKLTTQENGTVKFENVPIGEYTITETGIPEKYKIGDISMIQEMKTVKVIVAGDTNGGTRVTFTDDSGSALQPGGSLAFGYEDEKLLTTDGGTKLFVANTLKLGKAAGTKVALTNNAAGTETAVPVQGITFNLYNADKTLKLTSVTSAGEPKGRLEFTNLPYGTYQLEEVGKDGYIITGAITFTVNGDAAINIVTPGSQYITNMPVRNGGSFQKADQNGDLIKKQITFTVERKNDGLFGTPDDKEYAPYEEHEKLDTADGILTFEKFLYGEYRLTEKQEDNQDIHWAKTPAPVYLKVSGDRVQIGHTISNGTVTDYAPLTGTTTVTNQLQYGYVEVNKAVGEKKDGILAGSGEELVPIAGAVFNVYRQSAEGKAEGSPIMTLTTDATGKFVHDDNGFYHVTGGEPQALLVGSYVLKEVGSPTEAFTENTTEYPFEIKIWGSDDSKTVVYIDSNNRLTPGADAATKFFNEPKRNSVTLTKLDGETDVPVSGAEFSVYVEGGPQSGALVAVLKEKEEGKGKYELAYPVKNYQKKAPGGLTYLYSPDGDNYTLLHGTYTMKETTVPDNYENPYADKVITLTVGDDVTIQVEGEAATTDLTLRNSIKKTSIPLQKYVETRKAAAAGSEHDSFITGTAAEGFTFTITGTPSNAAADEQKPFEKTETTDGDGRLVFTDIPAGTYTITETGVPDVYRMSVDGAEAETLDRMKPVTVVVAGGSKTGAITVTYMDGAGDKLSDGTPGFVYGENGKLLTADKNGETGAKLQAANTLKLGDISGTKVVINQDADGRDVRNGLGEVTFELYRAGDTVAYTTARTQTGKAVGELVFKNLPYGEYIIKEVTPPGYIPVDRELKVTVSGTGVTVHSKNDTQIVNNLIRNSLKFSKTDQNGDLIKSDRLMVEFKVKPVGGDALADGIYSDKNTVFTNDGDGTVTLPELAYGTYAVTETGGTGKTFYILAARALEDENRTAITLSDTLDPKDPGSHAMTVTKDNGSTGVYDFTQTSNHEFKVQNQLKYARLDFIKVAADQDSNGNLVMRPDAKALAGVIFDIYRDMDRNGAYDPAEDGQRVLSLVTGMDGRPQMDGEGRYLDESGTAQAYRLVYGNRYLVKERGFTEESGLAEIYRVDDGYYALDVTKEYAGETVYFGTGATVVFMRNGSIAPGNIGFTAEAAGSSWRFPNSQVHRGTVVLDKADSDNKTPVKGAKLELFATASNAADVRIAAFDDKGTGTYHLIPGTAEDGFTPLNEAAQSYVVKGTDGEYHLLAGSYYIREVKAPSGYATPEGEDGKWYVTITRDYPDVTEADLTDRDGNAKTLTNQLTVQDVVITKQVEEFTKGTYRSLKEGDAFTFTLNGIKSNGDSYENTVITDPAAGKAVFTGVPGGDYTLRETLTEDQQKVYRTPGEVKVAVNEEGVTYGDDETVSADTVVNNNLLRGKIRARKMTHDKDGKELPLSGAGFTLTGLDGQGSAAQNVRTAVSAEGGWFEFEELPLGSYRLEENSVPEDFSGSGRSWQIDVKDEGVTVTEDALGDKLWIFNEAVGSITIQKRAEFLKEDGMSGEIKPGEGFRFRIAGMTWNQKTVQEAAESGRITGGDVELNADGIFVTTDADGIIRIDGLPAGNYTVTEVENRRNDSQGAYVLDEEWKAADITVKDEKAVEAEVLCTNRLKRSTIQGSKTMSDGKTPLKDAVIGLFADGTTEFIRENLYAGLTATSGEDGLFRFERIPTGTYRVAELTAPSGYRLNRDNYYTIKVLTDGTVLTAGMSENGEMADIVILNHRRSGGSGGDAVIHPTGSTEPSKGGPGVPTIPETSESTGPSAETTENQPPTLEETLGELPKQPDIPEIPVKSETGKKTEIKVPDVPEGTKVIIAETETGKIVYRGETDSEGRIHVDIPGGDYLLVTLDDNDVPLASMSFHISKEVPLSIPDAGDHSIPIALLVAILLGAVSGIGILILKRKKLEKEEA